MTYSAIAQLTTPAHILADAKELSSSALTRARQRAVVSRAYYAAYHAAASAADEKGIELLYDRQKRGGMHRQFIDSLRNSGDDLIVKVGRRLQKIYDRRISADYQLGDLITPEIAKAAIEDAEDIVYDLLGVEPIANTATA